MKHSILAASLSIVTASLAQSTNAPVITDNTPGLWVIIPGTSWSGNKNLIGQISASTSKDGGVFMTVNINGGSSLPIDGGPFKYHIHEFAVPSNGSCDATGAHLDPYKRGETPVCDSKDPESCQVGDLSGKHGACDIIPGCSKNFTDKYLSLSPGNPSYIGDKSIVIHYANKTRLACANFVTASNMSSSSTAPSSPSSTAGSGSSGSGSGGLGGTGGSGGSGGSGNSSSGTRPSGTGSGAPSASTPPSSDAKSLEIAATAALGLVGLVGFALL